MPENKSLREMQEEVDKWISQFKLGYFKPLEILGFINEETGELAREINNRFGPRTKKSIEDTADIGKESVDVIFNLICLANSLGIDLEEYWKNKMEKQYQRDNNRYERKEE